MTDRQTDDGVSARLHFPGNPVGLRNANFSGRCMRAGVLSTYPYGKAENYDAESDPVFPIEVSATVSQGVVFVLGILRCLPLNTTAIALPLLRLAKRAKGVVKLNTRVELQHPDLVTCVPPR